MKNKIFNRFYDKIDTFDRDTLAAVVKKIYKHYRLFELVVSKVKDAVVLIDAKLHVSFANPAAIELFDISDIKSVPIWKCCPDLAKVIDVHSLLKHSITVEFDLHYPTKKCVKFYSVPCDGEYAVCVFLDVTSDSFKKSQDIETEKINSIMLLSASIAHEIGNPLNSIMLQLDLISHAAEVRSMDNMNHEIDICRHEIKRLNDIIHNFLNAVKPVKPNFVDVNLVELFHSVVKFLKQELDNSKVLVDINIEREVPVIVADPDQLRQVFFNVIRNSVDAMSENARLKINFSSDDNDVLVRISDNGNGISAEKISTIFDPFVTSKKNGNGLGMFIIQRILRDHHASISVESTQNIGTSVLIKFPRKDKKIRKLHVTE